VGVGVGVVVLVGVAVRVGVEVGVAVAVKVAVGVKEEVGVGVGVVVLVGVAVRVGVEVGVAVGVGSSPSQVLLELASGQQAEPAVGQYHPLSVWQVPLHPSPADAFPSSHCSKAEV
jgi:hypothetical protein